MVRYFSKLIITCPLRCKKQKQNQGELLIEKPSEATEKKKSLKHLRIAAEHESKIHAAE